LHASLQDDIHNGIPINM